MLFLLDNFSVVYFTLINILLVLWLDGSLVITFAILAIFTLTLIRARNSSFEAFTVLLLTIRCLTFAPFVMFSTSFVHFRLKSLNIPFQNFSDSRFSLVFVFEIIEAIVFTWNFITLTLWTTNSFVPEAFAVKLETLGVLASASSALVDDWL